MRVRQRRKVLEVSWTMRISTTGTITLTLRVRIVWSNEKRRRQSVLARRRGSIFDGLPPSHVERLNIFDWFGFNVFNETRGNRNFVRVNHTCRVHVPKLFTRNFARVIAHRLDFINVFQ